MTFVKQTGLHKRSDKKKNKEHYLFEGILKETSESRLVRDKQALMGVRYGMELIISLAPQNTQNNEKDDASK